MSLDRCSGERRGRTNSWSGAQENFRDAYAGTSSEKENDNRGRDEKEITDANTIPNAVANKFAEKEKGVAVTGTNVVAKSKSEEEKGFTNTNSSANLVTAS